MTSEPLLNETEGHRELLLGNEAIVRGALEAGVAFAAGYPGTPSSEITDAFARLAPETGIVFEYSVNEKIALEMAFASSLAGGRSLCAMKHLGLMYAGDPLSTIPYIGTVGGMVIVSAGDPSCYTSPNEQDQRWLGSMLHIPVLDPSTPQEALEMTRFAFGLSEESRLPVLLRPTTRLCHSRSPVRFGPLGERRVTGFDKDAFCFVPVPANARKLRLEIPGRIETARELCRTWFKSRGDSRTAVLAAGVPAASAEALLDEAGLLDGLRFMTLGAVHPLPEEDLAGALRDCERVLVVEELSPFLEDAVRELCARRKLPVEILGKRTGHLPVEFEYEPDVILKGLRDALGLQVTVPERREPEPVDPRPPILCPSCPHRSSFFAARAAFEDSQSWFNDIGCYTLGHGAPLDTADALLSMGAGFTLAAGVSRVTGERTVGFIGDSTFFHSGMPALLDAIKEDANMVAVILDNEVTAMTGFQESPGIEIKNNQPARKVSIPDLVRALGARDVQVVDPNDLKRCVTAFERARNATGLCVVILERACPVYLEKATGQKPQVVYEIDQDHCRHCGREDNGSGMRCEQHVTLPFEREMARARSLSPATQDSFPPVAPCADACPLHLCIQGYAAHVASGEYADALELIQSRLSLPDSVCRVCHRPCESVCIRGTNERPVAINDLKRFVMDWAAEQESPPYEEEREPENGMQVAVVGAGPAGLAAARELWLRGYRVTVFDKNDRPGGLLYTGIPRYRLPREALERDLARIFVDGVRFVGSTSIGKELGIGDLLEDGHDAVFVATGAPRALSLELSGPGKSTDALAYLEAVNLGREVETGSRVVVIGGGNAAIDAARTARRMGANEVTIACLEAREEMPAIADEILEAEGEGVKILGRVQAVEAENGGLRLLPVEPIKERPFGPADFVPVEGAAPTTIAADQLIYAIGQVPDPSVQGKLELEWTEDGSLRVDPSTCRTRHPRVFAGGDLAGAERSVTGAIATGQRAAWGIDRELRGETLADRRMPAPIARRPTDRSPFDRSEHHARELPLEERLGSFREVLRAPTEEEARAEASRCMICGLCGNCSACIDTFGCPAFYRKEGQIRIDPEACTGCGVCADLCPNSAIVARER